MTHVIFLYSTLIICLLLPVAAIAQDNIPLEITANSALEWNQNAKTYTANGKAKAVQGNISVTADKLIAFYDAAKGGATNITRLEAHGHVNLQSGSDTAIGERAIYDLVSGIAILDGGRVKIIQEKKASLEADKITLSFDPARTLKKAEADGKVMIINAGQKGTGDKAVYTPDKDTAELIGRVRITQEDNWLEGDRAEINLTTHISRLTKESGQGQVKGVFTTQSKGSQ